MKAEDVQLTQLFAGRKQFIVPIFQRDYSWGTHASESGGVLFDVDDESYVAAAMHLIRQAYEKVSE
jgi:hypothetical protein